MGVTVVRGYHLPAPARIESSSPEGARKEETMKALFLLGRAVLGGFFVHSGIHHFQERKALAQYAAAKNVPMPDLAVAASGALLVAGGASIILGVKPKWGTLAIMTFLAGVTPAMHDFWNSDDPQQSQNDMVHFLKNAALLGSALALMGVEEPWPASVPVGQPEPLDRARRFARNIAA
jgi:putative oxidoreductase